MVRFPRLLRASRCAGQVSDGRAEADRAESDRLRPAVLSAEDLLLHDRRPALLPLLQLLPVSLTQGRGRLLLTGGAERLRVRAAVGAEWCLPKCADSSILKPGMKVENH